MQITVPKNVRTIIETLEKNGFEAYAVGGCVRDSISGTVPNDWDITTNALPLQVKSLFRRTIDIGIEHGTVKVMMGRDGYEITTYRIDGDYEDNRHPNGVTFTSDLLEDLRRRDFTINAMAYSDRSGLVDPYHGREDLAAGIIRAVGDPGERFSEDALRILRALRFSARFGFEIEDATKEAIRQLVPTLSNISAERIREELEKLVLSDNPDRLRWAYELGVTAVIFPEWDKMMECEQESPHHFTDVGDHTIEVIKYIIDNYSDIPKENARILRIAALLHDIAKPVKKFRGTDGADHFTGHPEEGEKMSEIFLKRLKYDNNTTDRVKKLVRYHDDCPEPTYGATRRFLVNLGRDNLDDLIRLKYADLYAHTKYRWDEKMHTLKTFEEMSRKIIDDKDPLTVKELAVNGNDLMKEGASSGPALGQALGRLMDLVLDDPAMNDKEKLLGYYRGDGS